MGDVQMPLPASMVFDRAHRYIQAKKGDGTYENIKFVDHNPSGAALGSPSGTGKAPVLTSESKVLIFTVCMVSRSSRRREFAGARRKLNPTI